MRRINMISAADKVEGQGVGSATKEQVNLVMEELGDKYQVTLNGKTERGISHYHTINFRYFLHMKTIGRKNPKVGHVHFLPETVEGSIKLPWGIKHIFYWYIVKYYKSMDYLVTVNPYFIERLVAHGIDREKVLYIPNYVAKDQFYPMKKQVINAIKQSYDIHEDAFVVLGVGQIQTRKGVLDFIEIAKKHPNITFVWAGGFSFGKITDGYETLKKEVENSPKNVKFIGIVERSKMNDLYNMANLLFMPSYNELFPMSILEAMNCETPMLLRDIDIYKGILNGYYLKADSNEDFGDIIEHLANDDIYYQQAVHMSKDGSIFYSRDHVLSMWKDFYQKVYDEKLGDIPTNDQLSDDKSMREKVIS